MFPWGGLTHWVNKRRGPFELHFNDSGPSRVPVMVERGTTGSGGGKTTTWRDVHKQSLWCPRALLVGMADPTLSHRSGGPLRYVHSPFPKTPRQRREPNSRGTALGVLGPVGGGPNEQSTLAPLILEHEFDADPPYDSACASDDNQASFLRSPIQFVSLLSRSLQFPQRLIARRAQGLRFGVGNSQAASAHANFRSSRKAKKNRVRVEAYVPPRPSRGHLLAVNLRDYRRVRHAERFHEFPSFTGDQQNR